MKTKRLKPKYRMRRQIFCITILVIFTTIISGFAFYQHSISPEKDSFQIIEVKIGDSVWSIAASLHPKEDIRNVVCDIFEMNDLKNAIIYPGQLLKVPKILSKIH